MGNVRVDVMGMGEYCKHRWAIIKRWTENDCFFAIERCRWCDEWKRSEVAIKEKNGRFVDSRTITPLITSNEFSDGRLEFSTLDGSSINQCESQITKNDNSTTIARSTVTDEI